jgi:hypothetical protein
MKKTTVYLPDELKAAVEHVAAQRHVSEADVIRAAIAAEVRLSRPKPRGSLYRGAEPIAERVDELLAGFGER